MLQKIHDKLKGWLAGVVLGAIALVFVFWGINWTLGAPSYVAKVNGVEITSDEVRQNYQQQIARFQRQTHGSLDDAQRAQIKRRVLEEFVDSAALVTRADELGYRVSDQDLLAQMAQEPAFQVDNKFDEVHALSVIRANGRSASEIEKLFLRDAKLKQLDNALEASSFVTQSELKRLSALTRQQRETAWLSIAASKYAADAPLDEAAVKAYYEAHKAQYMTPETVHLRYVEISVGSLASDLKVDDAQLKTFFEDEKQKVPERFAQPETRRVRHILLQVADPKDDAAVKAKAEDLLKRAQSGEDFSKLAKEFSQDSASAQQGGDLGWSDRKVWVAPFADAAFSMKEGEIRGPVKTQFGYHILKLDGIQPESLKTFEQSRGDLEADFRRSEGERLFNSAQDALADAALQNSTDIDVAARKAGLAVHDLPDFSRIEGGGELGKSPSVIDAAFSQDALEGHLSPLVEVEKGRGVVLKASDHKLPQQKPLEAVRTQVVEAYRKQRGAELAAQAAADAVKRLQGGESWDSVAKQLGLAAQPPKFIGRSDADVPVEVRKMLFGEAKPADKPVYSSVPLENGDVAVVALTGVREDPAADPKQQDAPMRRELAQASASAEAQGYATAARADAKVSLNLQALD